MKNLCALLILIALAFASYDRLLGETLSLAWAMFRLIGDDSD